MEIYSIPDGAPAHLRGSVYTVTINDIPCDVWRTEVTDGKYYHSGFAEYLSFSFDGKVTIRVESSYKIENARLLPTRNEIPLAITEYSVSFELDRPGVYFLRINGSDDNGNTAKYPLYIFAEAPERDIPSKDDPGVVWFSSGVHPHRSYTLESGKTYYLEAGALVFGRFAGEHVENVRICGRGTLCGEALTDMYDDGRTICIRDSRNITLEGLRIMHPKVWTVAFYDCENVHIDHLRTIAHGMSSDGCDICGCRDVLVENCFFRGHDDILAVKAPVGRSGDKVNPCENVTFRNCVAWCDSSNSMTIGYETVGDISNISFEGIDVLNISRPPVWRLESVMAIEAHYDGNIGNVSFRDIRVDVELPSCALPSLFRFCIDNGGGTIGNITVEDVRVLGRGALGGRIFGSKRAPVIEDITFGNIANEAGDRLSADSILQNEFVSGINVRPCGGGGAPAISAVYDFMWDFSEIDGFRGWHYRYLERSTGKILPMENHDERWARPDDALCRIQHGFFHPDCEGDPLLCWQATHDGEIELTAELIRQSGGGDGTRVYLLNGDAVVWERTLTGDEGKPVRLKYTAELCRGDTIALGADMIGTADCDGVIITPIIRYVK